MRNIAIAIAFGVSILSASPSRTEIITPKESIQLFNGNDLSNFYTYLGSPKAGEKPYGKNNDPEKVITVHDKMIHVTGKVFGGFATVEEYQNYHLVVEFKWGKETYAPRKDRAMDSGILLHCVGEDGMASGVWMESIECQMIEGGTGDFILVAGKCKPSLQVEIEVRGKERYYKPGGTATMDNRGRFNWYGRDPEWKDEKGFRGKDDVENPAGEWNTLECVCEGEKITNILNGKVVNVGTKASHTKGKIMFQSEGAELFFRKIELKPIKK